MTPRNYWHSQKIGTVCPVLRYPIRLMPVLHAYNVWCYRYFSCIANTNSCGHIALSCALNCLWCLDVASPTFAVNTQLVLNFSLLYETTSKYSVLVIPTQYCNSVHNNYYFRIRQPVLSTVIFAPMNPFLHVPLAILLLQWLLVILQRLSSNLIAFSNNPMVTTRYGTNSRVNVVVAKMETYPWY